jgi:hypothetical protein
MGSPIRLGQVSVPPGPSHHGVRRKGLCAARTELPTPRVGFPEVIADRAGRQIVAIASGGEARLSKRHGIAGRDIVLALVLHHAVADVRRVIGDRHSRCRHILRRATWIQRLPPSVGVPPFPLSGPKEPARVLSKHSRCPAQSFRRRTTGLVRTDQSSPQIPTSLSHTVYTTRSRRPEGSQRREDQRTPTERFRSSAKPSHASGSATAHRIAIGRNATPPNLA